jgi:hypothetical protein
MYVSVNNNDYIFVEFNEDLTESVRLLRICRKTKISSEISKNQFNLLKFKK